MNLQDLLSNPAVLDRLARGSGAGRDEARSGLEALLPAVMRGLERNGGSAGGLESLIGALGSGRHDRVLDAPDLLGRSEARDDGNAILGHVFGSKDVSRNVASHASEQTGLDSDLLKKLLPLVASVAMGALSRNSEGGARLGGSQPGASGSAGGGLLGAVLGEVLGGGRSAPSRGGEPLDDILDLAKKLF